MCLSDVTGADGHTVATRTETGSQKVAPATDKRSALYSRNDRSVDFTERLEMAQYRCRVDLMAVSLCVRQ